MSRFDELFRRFGQPVLVDRQADQILYLGTDDSWRVSAIVGDERIEPVEGTDGRKYRRVRVVTLFCSEVKRVAMSHQLEIDEEVWSIEQIADQTPTTVRIRVVRPERAEVAKPGYRRG